jgi:hypothetical protein
VTETTIGLRQARSPPWQPPPGPRELDSDEKPRRYWPYFHVPLAISDATSVNRMLLV